MTEPPRIVLAFDLYGTLLDTNSVATELRKHLEHEKADSVSALWRRNQTQYTWRLNSMGRFQDFSSLTRSALGQALADTGSFLSNEAIESAMTAFNSLFAFQDVANGLAKLEKAQELTPVIFSNGTEAMVRACVENSPELSRFSKTFWKTIVVESVKKYKPASEVYHHLARVTGKSLRQMEQVWLISGNPFDVVGARSVGMSAVWVDREGNGWTDRLLDHDEQFRPTAIVKELGDAIEVVGRQIS